MIESKEDLREYIAADLRTHGIERWRWHLRFTNHIASYQRMYRMAEYSLNCRSGLFGRVANVIWKLRLRRLSERYGYEIFLNVFGPGLSLAHRGSILVGPATIGSDCRIHQGVTIGQWDGKNPVIGDRVMIGVNSVIVGGVTIGDDVLIGTNVSVVRDIPSGSTVVSGPPRIISRGPDADRTVGRPHLRPKS